MDWIYTKENPLRVVTLCSGYESQCMAIRNLGIPFDLVAWAEFDPESKAPLEKQPAVIAHNAVFPEYADRNLEWCTQQYNVTYLDAHIKRGQNQRKAVLVFNKDGSLFGEFPCCEEAGKALGLRTETMHKYMAGKHKNKDGMTFQYKDSSYEPRTHN